MNTTAAGKRPLSYEEERGKPAPSFNHGAVQANLIFELGKNRTFRFFSELDLDLNGHLMTRDLSAYPAGPIDFRHDILRRTDPPLLVVEILSPPQTPDDLIERITCYLQNGVKSCWMVIPPTQSITIVSPDSAQRTFSEGTITDPVIGVSAELSSVFS